MFFFKIIFFVIINLFGTAILAKTTDSLSVKTNGEAIVQQRSNIRIVVTIKPLYNLVMALMHDVNHDLPILLLHGNVSPHDYSLKLSDLKAIGHADLVIWVGDQLEFFLAKLLRQPKFVNKLLTIQNLRGINKLKFRNSQYLDEHLWLSPENAKVIIKYLEKTLVELDPINSKKYAENRNKFLTKLEKINTNIKTKLTLSSDKKYLVFHDAYQYFEKFYGLQPAIAISDNPAIPLSIQRMLVVHDLILSQKVQCIFKEPQFSSKVVDSLLKSKDLNGQLKVGILDPLGSDQDLGADGYFKLLNNLSDGFYSCFK